MGFHSRNELKWFDEFCPENLPSKLIVAGCDWDFSNCGIFGYIHIPGSKFSFVACCQIPQYYTERNKWNLKGSTVDPFSCLQDGPHSGIILVPSLYAFALKVEPDFPKSSTEEPLWLHFFSVHSKLWQNLGSKGPVMAVRYYFGAVCVCFCINTGCWQEAAGRPTGWVLDPPLSIWEWLGWYSEASLWA